VLVLRSRFVALFLLCSCGGPEQAADSKTVRIAVDATAAGSPLVPVWAFHGYDEVNYATLPEGKGLLTTLVAASSAPIHVRNHFLFNTGDGTPAPKWGSTNVYTEDPSGSPVYDFSLTDEILDTITSAGAVPFVELGFMPQALSTHPNPYQNTSTIGLNGGCFYPPTDYAKWGALVGAWATHVDARYPDVAANWPWELWNEPDSGYWHGTFDEFTKLYDYSEAALHAAIPSAVLGGPAVIEPGGTFLTRFLEHCATGANAVTGGSGTRLDLVSFHAKGGVAVSGERVELDLGNQLRLHRSGFGAVAAFPQFKQTPIYITEADPDGCAACTADVVPGARYRTSRAYGAYEAVMMKRTLELAADVGVNLRGLVTWAFTFPGTPYFAGYRELATNGISLPVLGAFQLLGRLAGTRLPLTSSGARELHDILDRGVRGKPDIDGMATIDGGTVRVLVWNYHDDISSSGAAPVHLTIQLPTSFERSAIVSHLRIDEEHGDAYRLWVSQGSPAAPSPEEIAALQRAMEPAPLAPEQTVVVGPDHSVSITFDLPRFAISLLSVVSPP